MTLFQQYAWHRSQAGMKSQHGHAWWRWDFIPAYILAAIPQKGSKDKVGNSGSEPGTEQIRWRTSLRSRYFAFL